MDNHDDLLAEKPVRPPGMAPRIRATLGGHYHAGGRYAVMVVNVTNRCNLSCAHCLVFREGNPNTPQPARDHILPGRCGAWVVFHLAARLGFGAEPHRPPPPSPEAMLARRLS